MIALVARPMATRVGRVSMVAYDPVLTAIDEHVPPGGEIFIYPYAPMYYFLSATNNPTRYSVLYYNFKIHSRSTFDEAIQTLTQHRVKYVWWDRSAEDKLRVLFPWADLKQNTMEGYLTSHYRAVWTCKEGVLMERINDDHDN
jgi:hypothetical protein